jgi:ribosomal protein L3
MPGNMGNESVTVKNLKVLQIDEKNGIVVVNGMSATKVTVSEQRLTTNRMCTRPQESDYPRTGCARQAVAEGSYDHRGARTG